MSYTHPHSRLIIFTKAPIAGYCKTRLIPTLGQQGAALLQQELIANCIKQFCEQPLCPTELWCSPDTRDPFLQSLAADYELPLFPQQGTDLGQRMYHAMSYQNAESTIIIGTDCPVMTRHYLKTALSILDKGSEAVIGPAEDGGYVLLGLRNIVKGLFDDIPWGSGHVLQVTTQRMDQHVIRWQGMAPLWDLDEEKDLLRYRAM